MEYLAWMVEAREALGLSQGGLAELLGVSRPAVSQWESGKRPCPDGLRGRVEAISASHRAAAASAELAAAIVVERARIQREVAEARRRRPRHARQCEKCQRRHFGDPRWVCVEHPGSTVDQVDRAYDEAGKIAEARARRRLGLAA